MGTLLQDLRYGLRMLAKNPGFTTVAVLTLGLGIGGNTAMFTVIRAVLLRPLECRDPGRLVYFSLDNPRRNGQDSSFTPERFDEMKAAARSFTGLGAFFHATEDLTLSSTGEPEALKAARVSANFLDVLRIQPILGRSFLLEEDISGGRPVVMISAELWKRHFGSDSQVIGKTVALDSTPYTIVGVLPAGFEFPFTGVDVWVTRPSEWSGLPPRFWRFVNLLSVFGRLRPQVSLEEARAETEVLNREYILAHPEFSLEKSATMRVMWLQDRLVTNVRPMLWTLFGAMGFVLLIACANVAGLLLARATSRFHEFAVRAALGAGRGRLVRQLLAESLLLACAGGALGVLLAKWSLIAIARVAPLSLAAATTVNPLYLPGSGQIRLDGMVLGFTVALSIATGVLFGLLPSLQVSRPDLAHVLRESGGGAGRGSSSRRGVLGIGKRGLLVVGQVALSIVLLIGAALLIESFARLRSVDPGFQPANLLTMKIALPPARYDKDQNKAAFFKELVSRVEAVPGVRSAAMVMSLPTAIRLQTNITWVEGQFSWNESEPPTSWQLQSITPGYFHTLGIPLRRGREFTTHDNTPGAPPVVMINESFARRYWSNYPRGQDPVGRHMSEGADKFAGSLEIVGIVADIHERGLTSGAAPEFYIPCVVHPPQAAYLVVRTQGDPLSFINAIRNQLRAIDEGQPVSDLKTMQAVLEATLGQRQLTMWLLGLFAGVALLLATVGIYGVVAYSVAQRTREVGIRQALGAQEGDILRLVVGQGLALAVVGVALGLGAAVALTRVMKELLFQVSSTDPATFVGIALLFVVVALAASYIPARRATKVDPMVALRYE
jgi:predicted permease